MNDDILAELFLFPFIVQGASNNIDIKVFVLGKFPEQLAGGCRHPAAERRQLVDNKKNSGGVHGS